MKISDYFDRTAVPYTVDWETLMPVLKREYARIADPADRYRRLKECHWSLTAHLDWERSMQLGHLQEEIGRGEWELVTEWGEERDVELQRAFFRANRVTERLGLHQSFGYYEEALHKAFAEAIWLCEHQAAA
jgi:hypothetical protein